MDKPASRSRRAPVSPYLNKRLRSREEVERAATPDVRDSGIDGDAGVRIGNWTTEHLSASRRE